MAVKIWNLSKYRMVIPGVGGAALRSGEARVYDNIQYDELTNNGNIRELGNKIKIKNLDDMDIQFAGPWDGRPHMTIGGHEYWIDGAGTTMVTDGPPTSSTDGTPLGGAGAPVVQSVYSDTAAISSRSFAQVRSTFFNNSLRNRAMGTWDILWKYCYWSLSYPGGTWTTYQKFDTQDEFFTWMESVIPSSGGVYTAGALMFRTEEHIDTEDSFPQKVVHRNSLVASILGQGRYNTRTEAYGVSDSFNDPQYYTNYYNELGQRFVQEDTGALPTTNNDNVVWHTRRTRSKHGLPKVGSIIDVGINRRGAAWDSGTTDWVSPAPSGSYVVQFPFLLIEWRRRQVLQILAPPDTKEWGLAASESVSAIVFPVVSGTYRGYIVYPYNYDSFATEAFDLGDYELTLKLTYRNTARPIYKVIDPWHTVETDGEHLMWSHWFVVSSAPLWLDSLFLSKAPGASTRNVDSNNFPEKVFVARRNKSTGARSNWYPLYFIKRRIPYAPYRVTPAQYPR